MRGSWLDFDYDHKDILHVRIDRRRKMPATILLKAMGMTSSDILEYFYDKEVYKLDGDKVLRKIDPKQFRKETAYVDHLLPDGKPAIRQNRVVTKVGLRKLSEAGVDFLEVDPESLIGLFAASDISDPVTGEVIIQAAEELTAEVVERMKEVGRERL